ncbi:LysR substrate-binding domain-containing protein [Solimonas terrae]|uniref:LysR family transcriptional regulator n=1 Tax=Solimonas terrae TaxID=1396819 RepID=A0A6M2BX78_9GAMM|nr:LysR substrate-binding domain-containing protein [Solimonas terrae]NGY06743.1 LysR family transcriptional regulator [Solimonas terrae]
MDLNDLRYFALIVEHGGFSAAERHAHISKSKLSRRIALLEDRLGTRLLRRSTRRLALTEAGRAFHEHCAAMLVEADAARLAVEQLRSEPAGTVRMTCPSAMAQFYVTRLIADFMRQYPKVRVELDSTDRVINLLEERIDIALRTGGAGLGDPGLVARRIASGRMVLVASPDYVATHRPGDDPAHFAAQATISGLREGPEQSWSLLSRDGDSFRLAHRPRMLCSDFTVQMQAALGGVGIALLPLRVVWPSLEDGSLLRVARHWSSAERDIHLVFASRRETLPSVRALIDHLVQHVPSALSVDDALPPVAPGRRRAHRS